LTLPDPSSDPNTPFRTLSGRIFESSPEGVRGSAGAAVRVWTGAAGALPSAVTDADGRFEIANIPVGELAHLLVEKTGYAQQCAALPVLMNRNTTADAQLTRLEALATSPSALAPPAPGFRAISGVAFEVAGGERRPVSRLTVAYLLGGEFPAAFTVTNDAGRYLLCGLPSNKPVEIVTSAPEVPRASFFAPPAIFELSLAVPLGLWAVGATASSEYTTTEWSAARATGAPDVIGCADDVNAWASLFQDGEDWLELSYSRSVVPTGIEIFENYAAGSIVKVEVRDVAGRYHTVYEDQPGTEACPRSFLIPVTEVSVPVERVRISFDQRAQNNWNEIDAVRLIGKP
jgi:hypothetical protein